MLRLGLPLRRLVAPRTLAVRQYSEGFDISSYLSRIEAITKKPSGSRRSPQGLDKASAKASGRVSSNKPGSSANGPASRNKTRASAKVSERSAEPSSKPRTQSEQAAGATRTPSSRPTDRRNAKRRSEADRSSSIRAAGAPRQPRQALAGEAKEEEWSSLHPLSSSMARPSPRSGRRSLQPRKGGKPGPKARDTKRASAEKTRQQLARDSSDAKLREASPFLTPNEALEVMLRNQGTSAGGFIEPSDISLSSLQPFLVPSAVSYNTRVRSLLNSVSNVEDQQKLKTLVSRYVEGDFDDLVVQASRDNLSDNGLAFALSANRTLSPQAKDFLAKVGSGKIPVKSITQQA